MTNPIDTILAAARDSIGAVGLEVDGQCYGDCQGTAATAATVIWYFNDSPSVDLTPWSELVRIGVEHLRVQKRNDFLERELATLDRAENELRKSRATAWAVFDATPTPIFLEDNQGFLLFINKQAEHILFRDREDVRGHLSDPFFPWLKQASMRQQVIESRVEMVCEVERSTTTGMTAYLCTKFPIIGQDGEVGAIGTILIDISARRASERALKVSERSYREIFEKASDLIIIQSVRDRTITAVNDGVETLGYSPDELIGLRLDVLSAAEGPNVTSLEAVIADSATVTWPLSARDGTTRWYQFRTSQTQLSGDSRYLTIARDVTAEKLEQERRVTVEENLHRAQKFDALGRLASGVAHEFSNLLSVILSYADLLSRQLHEPSASDDLATIQDAATRATTLVRQLMTLGQRRQGTPVPTNVSQQVEQLEDLLHRSIGSSVQFDLDLQPTSLVRIDPTQLDRILVNLAMHSRAVPTLNSRFRITVRSATPPEANSIAVDHAVIIDLLDTGRGHSPSEVEELFEPFWSGVDGENRIGLATAYATIIHLGGTITALADETSTRFMIILPAIGEDEVGETIRTVLLTDDDPTVLSMLRKTLEYRGWRVLSARSGEEALAVAERIEDPIDIVVTDVVMPKMSGTELAQRLREAYPSIKVLFMSGYPSGGEEGGLPGDVVVKPFSTNQLLEAIERNLKDET